MAKDLTFGQRALRRILRELNKPERLEHDYASAILEQAKRNAARRPTPQAPMAAAVMAVDGASITPHAPADSPSVEVAIGSEFGSTIWPQFHHGPAPAGLWLYPATRDSAVLGKVDDSLEAVLRAAVRGF